MDIIAVFRFKRLGWTCIAIDIKRCTKLEYTEETIFKKTITEVDKQSKNRTELRQLGILKKFRLVYRSVGKFV